ncbi:MAG: DNA translocase FtsK 4TM domain-containing protein [Leptospirales bacterium]|nr:DNA translocase FtsK 4TM domain-containing protein [Leptospirales bacterium]
MAERKNMGDAISFLVFLGGILMFLALATHREIDGQPENLIGRVGIATAQILFHLLGKTAFFVPIFLLLQGGAGLYRGQLVDPLVRMVSILVLTTAAAIWVGLVSETATGLIGESMGGALSFAFGRWGAVLISFGIFLPAVFLSTGATFADAGRGIQKLYGTFENKMEGRPTEPGNASNGASNGGRLAALAGIAGLAMSYLNNRKNAEPSEESLKFDRHEAEDLPFFQKSQLDEPPTQSSQAPPSELRPPFQQVDSRGLLGNVAVRHVGRPVIVESEAAFRGSFNLDHSRYMFRTGKSGAQTLSQLAASYLNRSDERNQETIQVSSQRFAGSATVDDYPTATRENSNFNSDATPEIDSQIGPGLATLGLAAASTQVMVETMPTDDISSLEEHGAGVDDLSSDSQDLPASEVVPGFQSVADAATDEELDEDEVAEAEATAREKASRLPSGPATGVPFVRRRGGRYHLPTDILQLSQPIPATDVDREMRETTEKLEKVLKDYGIPGRVTSTQRGPIITLFEILLDPGVRLNKILGIENEIRMNLAVSSVRIVAPLPGKPTVGIEIPNRVRQTVTLGEVARKDREFFGKQNRLGIILGKDISGRNIYLDLARAPHLLIAGASGQGKSVFMNSVIASLLYAHSPEEVRFIMIDPKMVELKLYEGIPHLLMPVITDPRIAAKSLAWILQEMERRYEHLSYMKCRDIVSYNERMKAKGESAQIPYIVIVIDELSDLMLISPKEVEDALWRLAQKARAVGIHMIMATQRPSVDVITPHIKANAPARVAFHVAQKTDSRIILDLNGADALLGGGDMLYKSPNSTGLTRVQAPLITEEEIAKIVEETRRYGEPVYVDVSIPDEDEEEATDEPIDAELLQQAWQIIQESGKTSTSYVQRRLRIGYNRAANIIEALEQKGYLGPAIGTRPREILKRS